MTYSEYSRIMEITEAETDNAMIDIDFMLESACASHRLDVADLEYQFESVDGYDQDTMVRMYTEEANGFIAKVKAAWDKFCKWVKSIVDKIFKKTPDEKAVKAASDNNPEGIKLPFDMEKTSKEMDNVSSMLNPSYMKRLMKDIDSLSQKGIKVNINVKTKNHNYEHTPLLNQFVTNVGNLLAAAAAPAAGVVSIALLMKHIKKTVNFSKKIDECTSGLKDFASDSLGVIMSPIRELLSTAQGLMTTLTAAIAGHNKHEHDLTKKPEKTYEVKSPKDVKGAASRLLLAAKNHGKATEKYVIDRTKRRYDECVSTFDSVMKTAGSIDGFNASEFKSLCKAISEKKTTDNDQDVVKAQQMINNLKDDQPEEKKQESVIDDDTVFSSIFENTFANADAPKFAPDTTSAFLSTPDQNMNEIMALLDNF